MDEALDFHYQKIISEFLTRIAGDTYGILKNATQFKLTSSQVQKRINTYIQNQYTRHSKLKSYFFRDEPTHFYDFYVPLSVKLGKETFDDIAHKDISFISSCAIILGTAGSGKSILMRHLVLSSLIESSRIPVFIELRNINDFEGTLDDLIYNSIGIDGLDLPKDFHENILRKGGYSFYFDGYDEIVHDKRTPTARKIESLSKKYKNCEFVVSSRPDDTFRGWEKFSVVQIEPLSKSKSKILIEKLPYDDDTKSRFLGELESHLYDSHKSFLSNPLLLSIMLLTYGQYAEIPGKLSLFYNQAYEALFQKHDAAKGVFKRELLSELDIQDFGRVFSAFSLQTYDRRLFRFEKERAISFVDKAKASVHIEINSEDFVDDSLQGVCLLVEDGLELAFSHRSFQEYFVARFINGAMPEIQKRLIDRFVENIRFDDIFRILFEMNPELVERALFVPQIDKLLVNIGYRGKMGMPQFVNYLRSYWHVISLDGGGEDRVTMFGSHKPNRGREVDVCLLLARLYPKVFEGAARNMGEFDGFVDKYGGVVGQKGYKVNDYGPRSYFIRDLAKLEGIFSVSWLKNLAALRVFFEKKYAKVEDDLDQLLE